jgi:uncharacterized protein
MRWSNFPGVHLVTPMCDGCGKPVCECYSRSTGGTNATPSEPEPELDVDTWLLVQGIAATDRPVEKPLPKGLSKLDGSTTATMRVEPLKARFDLPLPLLYDHDKDARIGLVTAADATAKELRFTARIAPVGTAGYDDALLTKIWADVRAGTLRSVSVMRRRGAPRGAHPDGWTWSELSIVSHPANPDATITRVMSPDGEDWSTPASGAGRQIDPSPMLDSSKIDTDPEAKAERETTSSSDGQGIDALKARFDERGDSFDALAREATGDDAPTLRWLGLWSEEVKYRPGNVAAFNSALWICERGVFGTKPGNGAASGWRLLLKAPDLRGFSRERGGR